MKGIKNSMEELAIGDGDLAMKLEISTKVGLEELSSHAYNLAQQAGKLTELVSMFRIS